MTNYRSQPIEPFAVPARVLRTASDHDGDGGHLPPGGPGTAHAGGDDGTPEFPAGVDRNLMDVLVGVLLLAIYLISPANTGVAVPGVVLLLGILMWRLSERGRKIAGPMLTVATLLLCSGIMSYVTHRDAAYGTLRFEDPWLPVALGAGLYYTRVRCHTLTILRWFSAALLAAGLLPAVGWLIFFYFARYSLWFAVVLGLFLDFVTSPNHKRAPAAAGAPLPTLTT